LIVKELQLYLASASPRRSELLRQIGLSPRILDHGVSETTLKGEGPAATVLRLAKAKGQAAAAAFDAGAAPGIVLAADTVVALDSDVLGKPESAMDAARMLHLLAARTHEVLTGVYLIRTDDGRTAEVVETTRVGFRELDDATIAAYVECGEPMDKAGAYGIQGLGALLTDSIRGSWSNVVGLPLERLPGCLEQIGVNPLGLFVGRLRG
jgi:septum formation protein